MCLCISCIPLSLVSSPSKETLLARRLALRTPGEFVVSLGLVKKKKKSIQLLLENTKPAIILTVTESSQRGPKVVRVVLDEFKSHLEVRGTAGAPPSPLPTPASRGFRTPRVASSRSPPPPSQRDCAAPVERCDTCQSSCRHGRLAGIATGAVALNGGRQMVRRLWLVPWKLSESYRSRRTTASVVALVCKVFFTFEKNNNPKPTSSEMNYNNTNSDPKEFISHDALWMMYSN